MNNAISTEPRFFQSVIDAIPYLVFVVDEDVRIYHMNETASRFFGEGAGRVYMKRSGESLHCIHSTESPDGCGRSESCRDCIMRMCVNEAMRGHRIHHRQTGMRFVRDGHSPETHLLVSASPFEFERKKLVLLILENINELVELRECLPICANCKKIRNDENYWESVEHYLSTRHDLDFTHSICPECKKTLYPELGGKNH